MQEPVQSAQREEVISGSEAYQMARRRWQGGSVTLRGKMWYGRWRESILLEDGSEFRKQKNEPIGSLKDFPTKKLAVREMQRRLEDVNSLTYRPISVATFSQFAKKWRESIMINHKNSAQASEKSIIEKHLEKRWGPIGMKDIENSPEILQAWASSLDCEPKTQRNIVKLLKRMLDVAIDWRYILHNPLARVRLKPLNKVDSETGMPVEEFALSLDQMREIINAAPEPYTTMYWILGETGIRAGEVLALGWEHVDLERRVIRIRRKVWRGRFETVKSRKGIRDFSISQQLTDHLKARVGKSGLLFQNQNGTAITYDHAVYEEFQPLIEKLKIPKCGFHAFRHGNATLMDRIQAPSRVKMDRLGHEKLDTTNGYTHAVSEDDRRVAEQLGNLLTEVVQ
jgi:integrase